MALVLGMRNWLDLPGITIAGGSWSAAASNIATRDLSDTAVSADALAASTVIDIDLLAAYPIGGIKLHQHNLSSAATVQLQLGTSSGGSSLADTGAVAAWRFTPWAYDGSVYDVDLVLPANISARYARIKIVDTGNTAGAISIGGAMLIEAWRPTFDPEFGLRDGHRDLSAIGRAHGGADTAARNARPRVTSFVLQHLDLTEGDYLHQAEQWLGLTDQVAYLPYSDVPARMQQYGFAGLMTELSGLLYPRWKTRSRAFALEQRKA